MPGFLPPYGPVSSQHRGPLCSHLAPASPLVSPESPWDAPQVRTWALPSTFCTSLSNPGKGQLFPTSFSPLPPAPHSWLSALGESSAPTTPMAPPDRGSSLPTHQPTCPRQIEQHNLLPSSLCTHGCCPPLPPGPLARPVAAHLLQPLSRWCWGPSLAIPRKGQCCATGLQRAGGASQGLVADPSLVTGTGCFMAWLSAVLCKRRAHPRLEMLQLSIPNSPRSHLRALFSGPTASPTTRHHVFDWD